MTSSTSTAAFRILAAVLLAAAIVLDVSLAHGRATGAVAVMPAADCSSPAPSAPVPPPSAVSDPAAPPGVLAAFGSCGDGSAPSSSSFRK